MAEDLTACTIVQGQEVARWFFRVGGAAGTIAKSISAYDMTISDTTYGACKRWVQTFVAPASEARLQSLVILTRLALCDANADSQVRIRQRRRSICVLLTRPSCAGT